MNSNNPTDPQWEPATEPPRDRWGRPLVIPPDGGKAIAYTRCTTFVDTLDDPFNLTQWKRRMVAVGLSQRPDLLLRVNSLGPQPDKDTDDGNTYRRWKKQMDETCDAAVEAAKASASATIGTALHAITERMDRGLDIGVVPDAYKPHLRAYEEKTRDFTAVHIERFCVYDDFRIGGTPDRVLQIDGHDKLIIGDLKTGDTTFGILKIVQQLAVYARSALYHPDTGARTPLGNVDTDRGLIIALDSRTGVCNLQWIDLRRGWEAVLISKNVRDARTWKDLSEPYSGPEAATLPLSPTIAEENARDLTAEAKTALEVAIRNANSPDDLVTVWTRAGNQWTDHHTELARARKAELTRRLTVVR
jgi:hypothetical protein